MNKPRRYPKDYVSGGDGYNPDFPWLVYVLYCPLQQQVKYVGITNGRLHWRLAGHRTEAKAATYTEKLNWLRALSKINLMPLIRCVGRYAEKSEALARELELIASIGSRRVLYNSHGTSGDKRLARNRF